MIDLLARRREMMGASGGILPSGYTRIDYIDAPQKTIPTTITKFSSRWLIAVEQTKPTGGSQIILGTSSQGGSWCGWSNSRWGLGGGVVSTAPTDQRVELDIYFFCSGVSMTYQGTTITRNGSNEYTYISIFNDSYKYLGRIYGIKCTEGGKFDGIPAQRDSDGLLGLYDIANDIFYDLT